MATVEQVEDLEQRFITEMSRDASQVTVRYAGRGGIVMLHGAHAALEAMYSRLPSLRREGGLEHGSVREFGKAVGGAQRDVVDIGDKRVLAEVRSELRKSGVEFAVDRRGKEVILHFRTSDSKVLAAALERATERVDKRVAEAGAKRDVAEAIRERTEKPSKDSEAKERELDRDQDAPEREGEVRDAEDLEREARDLDAEEPALEVEDVPARTGKLEDKPAKKGPARQDGPEMPTIGDQGHTYGGSRR